MTTPHTAWANSPAIWATFEKIELLPYHELGKHKWVAMGEEYKLDGVKPPKKETMERVKGILEQYGHKVMY
ncbi:pyruvate formate lyase-activating enzyme 1 [Citrobacter koseri]|nr:pyruvate formate lyase-activating enzyme 1 [Citrobacter koseri]